MVKYLLDTNFLMYCVKEKIDFLEELGKGNIIIPMGVILELEGIKREGSVRDKDVADIVLKMIADIRKINLGDGHVDNLIINFAKNNDVIVGTMDKTLQKRIKKNGIRILEIVGRKKLRIE
ncbi:hypothetical protein HYV49_06365 [Candidatus Pacearchaeota archaeon]|nr:hypothetical protein [Candidatus Pacearchaeota archaeon]